MFGAVFIIGFQSFRKLLFRMFFNRFTLIFNIELPMCMVFFFYIPFFDLHSHILILVDFILLFILLTFSTENVLFK